MITIIRREHKTRAYLLLYISGKGNVGRIRSIQGIKYSKSHQCYYLIEKEFPLKRLENRLEKLQLEYKIKDALSPVARNLLEQYKEYLLGKRYSKSTISTYLNFIQNFVIYLNEKPIKSVNNSDVRLFVQHQVKNRRYSVSTHRQLISALIHFGKLFLDSEIDTTQLERPRSSSYLPLVLSEEEVIDLLRSTRNLKHRVVLALLYSCGLRIGELISLELFQLDIDRRQLFVKNGKGRKDRVVILAETLLPLLSNYLTSYKPQRYFVEGRPGEPYSPGSVRKFLKRSCERAGIMKRVTPHTLRHSYATHLIEKGVGLRYVQELLGHAKPETTMIYTHVAKKDLLAIRSPLDTALERFTKSDTKPLIGPISGNLGRY